MLTGDRIDIWTFDFFVKLFIVRISGLVSNFPDSSNIALSTHL